jgi:hypothetical protein
MQTLKWFCLSFCLCGILLAVGGFSPPPAGTESDEGQSVAVSAFGHVALPYCGEGSIYYDLESQVWVIGFPAPADKCQCNWLGYEFCGPSAEEFGAQANFGVDGLVQVYQIEDWIYVAAADGKNIIQLRMTSDMVPAPPPPLPLALQQATPDDDCSVQKCPGGCCKCSGPMGTAEACCPAGFRADCHCTKTMSRGQCIKVVDKDAQPLRFEEVVIR